MKSLFREQVQVNHARRLQGEVSLVQVTSFTWLTGLIAFIVFCGMFLLLTGSYTRKEVVIGVLQPQQGVIRVQTTQAGTVKELFVKEDEKVEAGQPLLQLDMSRYSGEKTEYTDAMRRELLAILFNLEQQKNQEHEKNQIKTKELTQHITSSQKQYEQLIAQQLTFKDRVELNRHLVEQLLKLSGTGFISSLELSRQQDTLLSLLQQEQVLESQQLKTAEQLTQYQSMLKQLPLEHNATLTKLDNQISEFRNQLTRLQHEQSSIVRSPIAGTVSGILPNLGQHMVSGDIALSLVPMGAELEVVVYVPSRAIAFIEQGQDVKLRFHAFPYQRFGVHQGKVKEVSNTVLFPKEVTEVSLQEPSYRVRVQLSSQHIKAYDRELALRAGMTLDADVITERRSLLRWLFDPIYSIKGQF